MTNDGARDQLRKKCDEQTVVKKIKADHAAYIRVDEKGELRKVKNEMPSGSGIGSTCQSKPEQSAEVRCDEARIFEIPEEEEIESQSNKENRECWFFSPRINAIAKPRIASNRQQQNPQIAIVPPAVKK